MAQGCDAVPSDMRGRSRSVKHFNLAARASISNLPPWCTWPFLRDFCEGRACGAPRADGQQRVVRYAATHHNPSAGLEFGSGICEFVSEAAMLEACHAVRLSVHV